jgi:DNA-binding MarR family transcriptional regulator
MSQLSLALEVTARSVTKLVDALEKEGLVQRLPHATDRRVTLILLTPAGVTACKQTLLQNMPEAMCEIYTHLSPKQRRDMEQSLRILIDVLATMES